MLSSFTPNKNNHDNLNKSRPDFYQDLVTQQEYEVILDKSIQAVTRMGKVISVKDGTIILEQPDDAGGLMQFHLDNLVRKCKSAQPSEWDEIILDHFQRFPVNKSKGNYIYKDFEFAQDLLKVQVRAYDSFNEMDIPDFVTRIDIPDTYTFLILEYDQLFHFVRREDILEWEKSEDELFAIALGNVAKEEMDIQEYLLADDLEMYAFFSGDYSASFMVELEKNGSFAVGRFGSVVTIPTKGTALVHPIQSNTALSFISAISEGQQEFLNDDPVPISARYYWYYQQQFTLFPEEVGEGTITVSHPEKLMELLQNNL